jgi:hypothetical protein
MNTSDDSSTTVPETAQGLSQVLHQLNDVLRDQISPNLTRLADTLRDESKITSSEERKAVQTLAGPLS